jgi:D-threo-aldose 1-dehydrogenase
LPVRVAVIGAGVIGRTHIRILRELPAGEGRLAAIVDPSAAAAQLAAEAGVPHFTDADAMLDAVRPEGVVIATPNALHVAGARACIQRGIAVLVEKPLADDLDHALALAGEAKQAEVPLLVGHYRRHNPLVRAARDAIQDGRLGRIVTVSADSLVMKPDSYFDTAALYAAGESERRLGAALRGRPREEFVLSTKIGRYAGAEGNVFDYGAAATESAIEASLGRLGLDRLDIVFIHDVIPALHGEAFEHRFAEAMTGAWPVLRRLRREGRIGAIGVALREPAVALRFLREADFDCCMLAGGWTLLQHEALSALLPHCAARGTTVMVAAPFDTGILATGPVAGARYAYQPAPPDILARAARLQAICERRNLPLAAAALRFPLLHPAVVSVVAGHQSVAELQANLSLLDQTVPQALWRDMVAEGLLPADLPIG